MSFREFFDRAGSSLWSAITIASTALVLIGSVGEATDAQETAGSVDLRLRIVAKSTGEPVPDASVSLLAEDSALVDHTISDGEGRASMEPPPGTYRIRVERMDLEPWTSEPFTVQEGEERTIRIPLRPVTLPELDVETERGRCPGTREERRRGYERYREVVEQLRPVTRLEASDRHVFQVRIEERTLVGNVFTDTMPDPPRELLLPRPIATLDPDSLARRGYIQPGGGASLQYYPPTAGTVISDAFARTHCFRAAEGERGDRRGVAFQPLPGREVPDVEGEVWLDADTGAPLELDFTYTGLNRILQRYEVPRIIADIRDRATLDLPGRSDRMTHRLRRRDTKVDEDNFGGRLTFDVTDSGSWITRSWHIRMPIVWGREHWMSNARIAARPEIVLSVEGVPMERQGVVTGVVRILADSAATDSAGRGPGVEHWEG